MKFQDLIKSHMSDFRINKGLTDYIQTEKKHRSRFESMRLLQVLSLRQDLLEQIDDDIFNALVEKITIL